jgi:hypothetical protein
MTKEDKADTICELIHETAIHFKDGLITQKEAEKKIDHLLKRLDEILKQ